jgi:hypothetical protein
MPLEAGVAVGSCYSQRWSEVVGVDTDKMNYEMSCSAKMSLVGEEAAEVAEVGIVHMLADSYCLLSWDPPAREGVVAEERTDCKLLYRTAHNSHRHWVHKPGHSAAGEGADYTDRKGRKRSGAEADTDGNSVVGNDHIGAGVEGDVGDVEPTKTDTAYGTAEAVVDVQGDVPTGVGALCSGEEAGAVADEWGDEPVEERDAEVAEAAARMGGVEPVEVLDS